MPAVLTMTAQVPAVVFLVTVAVNEVEDTTVVVWATPLTYITLCEVKLVPVQVCVIVPTAAAVLVGLIEVNVIALLGESDEAC